MTITNESGATGDNKYQQLSDGPTTPLIQQQQQQQQQQPMAHPTHQPMNQPMALLMVQNSPARPWKYGLCDCFEGADGHEVVMSYFFPCFQHARNVNIFEGRPEGDCCNIGCCLYFVSMMSIPSVSCCLLAPHRAKVRARYHLEEDCNDYLAALCCPCCTLIQLSKEVKAHTSVTAPPIQSMHPAFVNFPMQGHGFQPTPPPHIQQVHSNMNVGHPNQSHHYNLVVPTYPMITLPSPSTPQILPSHPVNLHAVDSTATPDVKSTSVDSSNSA